MSVAVMVRAMANAAWGDRPLPWESCGALLDRLPPDRDVVASLQAGGFLACMLGTRVAPNRLFLHASADCVPGTPSADACGDTGTALGAEDREPWHAVALPWPAPSPPPAPRRRRVDTLYAGSHAPGLLVLGGANQAAILRGAPRVLAARRPMLLLDFSAVAPAARAALWEGCVQACVPHDYAWHDALLLPCDANADRQAAVAVLGHAAGIGLPAESVRASAIPDGVAALLDPEDVAVAALTWDAAQGRVPHHEAVRQGHSTRLDARLPTQGFYPPETDGRGGFWRWTGPGPCAALMLPIPGNGPWRLRLDVVNWGVARAPGTLRAAVGGAFVPVERQSEDFISFAPLKPPLFWTGAPLRVDLTTKRPPRASKQDPRCLGVCLAHAALMPL